MLWKIKKNYIVFSQITIAMFERHMFSEKVRDFSKF